MTSTLSSDFDAATTELAHWTAFSSMKPRTQERAVQLKNYRLLMRNCSAFALCAENFAFSLLTRTEDKPLIYFLAQSTKTLQLDEQCTLPSDFDAVTTELDLPSKGGNTAQRQAHARAGWMESGYQRHTPSHLTTKTLTSDLGQANQK